MSTMVNAADVIGKTLFARQDVPVYIIKPAQFGGKVIGTVKSGNPCGVVYSFVIDSDGTLLWTFKGGSGISFEDYYFIPHRPGNFSMTDLRKQGVISTYERILKEEQERKKANETFIDKAQNTVEKIAITAILVFAAVKIFTSTNNKS